MTLLDANILLYATNADDPHHARVASWFDDRLNSGDPVGLPWPTLTAFLRISTNPRYRATPLKMEAALEYVEDWLEWDSTWIPEPQPNHFEIVAELLRGTPRSKLVPDAHLAAIAIGHALTLCSTDVDFRLFKGLRLLNPLD